MNLKLKLATVAIASILAATPIAVNAETPKDQLIIGLSMTNLLTMDPAEAVETESFDVLNNLYDRLIEMDPVTPSKIVPGLAEKWTIAEDGTITFNLRSEAKFHSGNPVTSADVVWSLKRVMKLNRGPASFLREIGYSAEVLDASLSAPDAHTVVLKPSAKINPEIILFTLARTVGNIIDSKTVLENQSSDDLGKAWLTNNSAGSGPFVLKRWNANDSVILDRNASYWRGEPELKRVVIRHMPESQSQRLQIENGDLDVARSLSATDLKALKTDETVKIQKVASGGFYYLAVSTADPVFSKPEIRAILPYLIDYEGMQTAVIGDYGSARQVPVPADYPGAIADPGYKPDIAKAKELLAKAGYPDGFSTSMLVLSDSPFVEIATALQGTLGQAGIKVDINQGNGTQVYGKMRDRQFSMIVGRSGGQMPNVLGAIQAYTSNFDNGPKSTQTASLAWRTSWDIPELTALTAKARAELNEAKRLDLYKQIQEKFLSSTPPLLAIAAATQPSAIRANVQGLVDQQARSPSWYYVKKTSE
ncbi:ABC transporter substrate-binding protein [Phyllobacterium chamaecytisi]|uniref:ABC transporter substrate-binding protein n=1 Tax=Phyllobacterium chamaecytisi TaxID=2876082 RepID=UPI001CCEB2A4|nr:ABC transporter substrate-binding protein [Phyllobacterium sp. KW56]MBZ9605325.1 ABC transporter substrate-binding protein [Phyllobacterium sp. KW56]